MAGAGEDDDPTLSRLRGWACDPLATVDASKSVADRRLHAGGTCGCHRFDVGLAASPIIERTTQVIIRRIARDQPVASDQQRDFLLSLLRASERLLSLVFDRGSPVGRVSSADDPLAGRKVTAILLPICSRFADTEDERFRRFSASTPRRRPAGGSRRIMSEQRRIRSPLTGPGNKVIVTTLLEALAVRGLAAAHERALRSLAFAEGELAGSGSWLGDDALPEMMTAAEIDPSVARSVGHRLVAPDAMGIALYGLGLATPEKAYRRVQALLPRERANSSWIVEEMACGSARLGFRDGDLETSTSQRPDQPVRKNNRGEAALCALRMGMLEAIPGIYGLLPAHVRETSCRFKGSDACRYEISWRHNSRTGLRISAGFAVALPLAMLGISAVLGLPGLSLALGCAGASILAVALGSCYDLHRQLEAVAGARRGHLALFDQVDDALALKLDALARVETKLEGDEPVHVRTRIGMEAESSNAEQVDLAALLERAIETTGPTLPDGTKILFDHDDEPALVECEPAQIEQVVNQLLRNASTASQGLCESPEIRVTLSRVIGGVEFAIEDRGVGIDPSEIDEVFDPFFAERQAGVDEGFGLPVCLRIVERHGGELRIEVEDRAGTRVVVFLPELKESRL